MQFTLEDLDPLGWVIAVAIFSTLIGWFSAKFFLSRNVRSMQERVGNLELALNTAHNDSLTGLPNRTVADRALDDIREKHLHVSVGIVDINGLKQVNDDFGHEAGDEMIIAIAHRLLQLLPKTRGGLVARLGGDEFLIIAPGYAEELASAYEHAFNGTIGTAAIGIAESTPDDDDVQHVKRCADKAMYAAKLTGPSKVVIWTPVLGEPNDDMDAYRRGGDRRTGSRAPLTLQQNVHADDR